MITVGKFRNHVKNGLYNKKQLVNMLVHFLDMQDVSPLTQRNLEKVAILKQTLGVENMTREEMILKGLIKPATQPSLPEDTDSCDITEGRVVTDYDVAKKYLQLQESARKRGKEFNITLSDVRTLLKKKVCHYTGMKFTDTENLKRTIDRVDNTKGYVKGNVVACSHIANQLKEMLVENKDSPFKDNTKALKKFINSL